MFKTNGFEKNDSKGVNVCRLNFSHLNLEKPNK